MPSYQYRARNNRGQVSKGVIKASSAEQASALLQKHGLVPIDVVDAKDLAFWKRDLSFSRVKIRDRAIMARQLGSMVDAGMPILQATQVLAVQTENPKLANILREIAYDVEGGAALSEGMAKFPDDFPEFFVSMVRSGEQGGSIAESLLQLADYAERDDELITKARGAFIYPIFVVSAMIILGIIMMALVLPQLITLFESADVDLPIATRMLIAVSNFMVSYWWFLIMFIAVAAWLIGRYVRTPEGRYAVHSVILRIPKIGNILSKLYLARFTSALQTLVDGDIPVVQALLIARDTVNNRVYSAIINATAEAVKNGSTISAALEKYPQIPMMVVQMINVGERSGQLASSLGSVNRFYRREVDSALDGLSRLIEPVVIVILGIAVGVLIAAILMPIYQLVQVW